LDRLAEFGDIKLYRSENSQATYDLEITEKGELGSSKGFRRKQGELAFKHGAQNVPLGELPMGG
jgi:hypothetical protein